MQTIQHKALGKKVTRHTKKPATEWLACAGAGYEGCYLTFRRGYKPFRGGRIAHCNYESALSADCSQSHRTIRFQLVLSRPQGNGFSFLIPAAKSTVSNLHCTVNGVPVRPTLNSPKKNRLLISFEMPTKDDDASSSDVVVEYDAPVFAIRDESPGSTTVGHSDFLVSAAECDRLTVEVSLPQHTRAKAIMPPARVRNNKVRFETSNLRPAEYFGYTVGVESGF